VPDEPLTELERELLALASDGTTVGMTTTILDEEGLASSPGRAPVEATLRSLLARGLLRAERERWVGAHRPRDGIHPLSEVGKRKAVDVDFDDDWWIITDAGRAAIGLPPRAETVRTFWMNPSSGPFRVSPLLSPLCAWRVRRGKDPVPRWYERLVGRQWPSLREIDF
jgi:hypothetical protein